MLLFSTSFQINKSLTRQAFIRLVKEWNLKSPHQDSVIAELQMDDECNRKYGTDDLWMELIEYPEKKIIAVRYEKKDQDGIVWDTDYVINFEEQKLAVRMERSSQTDASSFYSDFMIPYFVTLLVDRGYLKQDGAFPVTQEPVWINEENIYLYVNVVNANSSYAMPVIYISKTCYNELLIDLNELVHQLKGIAHVLVQDNYESSQKIRELCDGKNEYNGAIGLYMPNARGDRKKFLPDSQCFKKGNVVKMIKSYVIRYLNSMAPDVLYTWNGVNQALLTDRFLKQKEKRMKAEMERAELEKEMLQLRENLSEEEKRMKAQALYEAKTEAETILDGFEEDMQKQQRQIEELTKTCERLQLENQGLRLKYEDMERIPVLYMGRETDFYPGEIKDIVLSTLSDALMKLQPGTRRADIISDIIKNNKYQNISEKKAVEVKHLLRNYNGMNGKLKQSLEDLGFSITDDGKHCRIIYFNDERYQTFFAKTPSDTRSGKNNAARTVKMAF